MIDLMLHAPRKQLASLDLEWLAVDAHGTDDDTCRALDVAIYLRNRQAPLFALDRALAFDDLGIDEHDRLLVDVDDGKPLEPSDLRRGETDPLRRVHRLEHVVDKAPQLWREVVHKLRRLDKNGVAKDADVQQTHESFLAIRPVYITKRTSWMWLPRAWRSSPSRCDRARR